MSIKTTSPSAKNDGPRIQATTLSALYDETGDHLDGDYFGRDRVTSGTVNLGRCTSQRKLQ